jgi:hypothetical protein
MIIWRGPDFLSEALTNWDRGTLKKDKLLTFDLMVRGGFRAGQW